MQIPSEIIAFILLLAGINPAPFGSNVLFFYQVKILLPYISSERKKKLFLNACKKGRDEALFILDSYNIKWYLYDNIVTDELHFFSHGALICAKKGHTKLLSELLIMSNFLPVRELYMGKPTCQTMFIGLLHDLYVNAICKKRYKTLEYLRSLCEISDAECVINVIKHLGKGYSKMKRIILNEWSSLS